MEEQYQRFMGLLPDPAAAARAFVEHWSGTGSWERIGDKARAAITALVPKMRLEMIAARSDTTKLQDLSSRPPTAILVARTDARCAACDCPPACSCIQTQQPRWFGCGPHDSADAPSGRRRRHPRVMTTER